MGGGTLDLAECNCGITIAAGLFGQVLIYRRKGKRSNYSAIIVVAKDKPDRVHYVIAADIARRTPDQTIEKIIEYCRIYPIARVAFEKNQFQEIMLDN